MAKIFISYRRDDSQYQADKLHAALKPHVANPRTDIFIDVDNIPLGVDFATHLEGKVGECEVLLALIGDEWLNIRDPATGRRRLDDPKDFVRIEIAAALQRGIPVVPVLFDGASIPPAEDLPEDLKPLARRNGLPVTRASFDSDMLRLVNGLPIDLPGKRKAKAPSDSKPGKSYAGLILGGLVVAGVGLGGLLIDPLGWFIEEEEVPRVETPAETAVTEPFAELIDPDIPGAAPDFSSVAERTAGKEPRAAEPIGDYKPGDVFSDCAGCPSMIVVPAGTFTMGSPPTENGRSEHEGPQRTVTIGSDFAVGRYEVTWAEWDACVADGGCSSAGPDGAGGDEGWGKGERPVINVSWDDAQAYVSWLSRKTGKTYRLLSEAEWEYAARAGTSRAYWWGSSASHEYANYGSDECCSGLATGRDQWENTAPVGSFPANGFGLYDMHGNVWEWTQDCWNDSYSGAPKNGSAWTSGNCSRPVVRGGSWYFNPQILRSADRFSIDTWTRDKGCGFRVARTL
jgi:formylglycine-generating enzyme required for sulfatase activity